MNRTQEAAYKSLVFHAVSFGQDLVPSSSAAIALGSNIPNSNDLSFSACTLPASFSFPPCRKEGITLRIKRNLKRKCMFLDEIQVAIFVRRLLVFPSVFLLAIDVVGNTQRSDTITLSCWASRAQRNQASRVLTSSVRCGDIINSVESKNGTIESPNYPRPYPADLSCRFTFQGVGKERVQLRFIHMDLHFPSGDPASPVDCTGSDSVTVYILVNGKMEILDTYCGEKLPPMLMSNTHTMTVEFRSYRSANTVTGFRANYEFVTNFGITTGKQDRRGTLEGKIMSPNWPGLYPRNTECHYIFFGREKEQVHISFLSFEVDGIPPRCEEHTSSDYVAFSNFQNTEDRKLSRMCSQTPGHVEQREITSDGPFFRVTFKSNEKYDAHGFQAYYQFRGEDVDLVEVDLEEVDLEEADIGANDTEEFCH
ncbi:hypothetical protein BaRGS_00005570 [Batillaria attramentaria]|uniref:CUB domain-containing protein n=1 Tax=Batillaria attramentaria TaxID=370345 RepID=A0ABD0LUS2_9CAEN